MYKEKDDVLTAREFYDFIRSFRTCFLSVYGTQNLCYLTVCCNTADIEYVTTRDGVPAIYLSRFRGSQMKPYSDFMLLSPSFIIKREYDGKICKLSFVCDGIQFRVVLS